METRIRKVDPSELFESRSWSILKKVIRNELSYARTRLETAATFEDFRVYQGQVQILRTLEALPDHFDPSIIEED